MMAGACTLTRLASGATLGMPLGIVFCGVILLPGIYAAGSTATHRLMMLMGGLLGGLIVLLLAGWGGGVMSLLQSLACLGVIMTLSLALAGGVECLLRLKVTRSAAAAMMMILGLLWLTWPVLLAPLLASNHLSAGEAEKIVSWLVPAHPLLSINGVLIHRGVWNEQAGVAYRLTNLAQDIPYAMPPSAWRCISLHAAIALGLWLLAMMRRPRPGHRN